MQLLSKGLLAKRFFTWAAFFVLTGAAALAGCAPETNTASTDTAQQDPSQVAPVDSAASSDASSDSASSVLDVPYVPTSRETVSRMLEIAGVTEQDTVYDLGSGDGRIVIAAAEEYGAHGVGIEIDAGRVQRARENAQEAGVADRVEFRQEDLFEADLSGATAVTLYLLPSVNEQLRPKLMRELRPGTPIVSHDFDMGDWEPERTEQVGGDTVYLWTIPENAPADSSGE